MEDILKNSGEFETFYKNTFPLLYKITTHITNNDEAAEDICQEAFIKLKEKAPVFSSEEQVRFWLIRVAKNMGFNFLKRKGRERAAYEKITRQPERKTESGEDLLLRNETKKIIKQALVRLPEKLKAPLILKEYGDLSYREISGILGISENNVKIRIFRARNYISQIINQEDLHVS